MTRAERSARNKRAHAIRRMLTDADRAQARAEGLELAWREISDAYATMDTDTVLATFGHMLEGPAKPPVVDELTPAKVVTRRRSAPAHIARAQETFALARTAWETGLESALAGARSTAEGGRPARGETYVDEERDYRDSNPAPVFKTFLQAEYAAMRAATDEMGATA